jgi:hypothetical protein
MARKRQKKASIAKTDLGTPETRRRMSPDPLLSTDLDVHRASAALAAIQALRGDWLQSNNLLLIAILLRVFKMEVFIGGIVDITAEGIRKGDVAARSRIWQAQAS